MIAGIASYLLARYFASQRFMLDAPGARSSHTIATPRAGGIAIFGGFAAAMILYLVFEAVGGEAFELAPLFLVGSAVFAFGAFDDVKSLRPRTKLVLQIACASAFVAVYGPVTHIPAPFIGILDLGFAAFPLTVLWIVGFMNVFNFMDGINGIAGACALFVLAALAVVGVLAPSDSSVAAIFLAAALFGYLPLNFGVGRLFMGDGGSQFVGFMIAALAVLAGDGAGGASRLFAPIAILPFIVDVGFTLAHRFRRGRNVLKAHNEHVYQLMVRMGRSHDATATLYLTLVIFSTAVAIAVNLKSSGVQYAAGAALSAALLAFCFSVYRSANAAGLFEPAPAAPDEAIKPPQAPQRANIPAAAE